MDKKITLEELNAKVDNLIENIASLQVVVRVISDLLDLDVKTKRLTGVEWEEEIDEEELREIKEIIDKKFHDRGDIDESIN